MEPNCFAKVLASGCGSMTLKPVADRLGEFMKKPVTFLNGCVGAEVEAAQHRAHGREELAEQRGARQLATRGRPLASRPSPAFLSTHRNLYMRHGLYLQNLYFQRSAKNPLKFVKIPLQVAKHRLTFAKNATKFG